MARVSLILLMLCCSGCEYLEQARAYVDRGRAFIEEVGAAQVAQAEVTPIPTSAPAPPVVKPAPEPGLKVSEVIALLLDSKLETSTPEQASTYFARAGKLENVSVARELMILRASEPNYILSIVFNEDGKGGWVFANLELELAPREVTQQELYRDARAQLQKKLKKPRWTNIGLGKMKTLGFRVNKTIEVVLAPCLLEDEIRGVSVSYGAPEGDP